MMIKINEDHDTDGDSYSMPIAMMTPMVTIEDVGDDHDGDDDDDHDNNEHDSTNDDDHPRNRPDKRHQQMMIIIL